MVRFGLFYSTVDERLCPTCGALLPPPPARGGVMRRWCSESCRLQAVYARRRAARCARRAAWSREMAAVLGEVPELTMNEEEPCK